MSRATKLYPTGKESGWNLIEVIFATGVLAFVLIGIITLFMLGTQSVKSGRETSRGSSIGQDVMEEMSAFPYEQSWRVFNGQLADETESWNTDTAIPTYSGDNAGYDEPEDEEETDGPYTKILKGWKELADELHNGKVSFFVEGMQDLTNTTTAFKDSKYLRITVTVSWDEIRGRQRHVRFQALKF